MSTLKKANSISWYYEHSFDTMDTLKRSLRFPGAQWGPSLRITTTKLLKIIQALDDTLQASHHAQVFAKLLEVKLARVCWEYIKYSM